MKVLVLSRNYPNNVTPILGLWVERLVRHSLKHCQPKVVAPVPYFPPLPWMPHYTRFRSVERQHWAGGVEVFHPRFLTGPGYMTHRIEWATYYLGVRGLVRRLHRRFPFDLLHAHFVYPDGVVAARLARRYGVPLIITEQVRWRPWLDQYPGVRRQALWAVRQSTFQIAISTMVRDSMAHFLGELPSLHIIPDGVDGSVFTLPPAGVRRIPNQVLFVGVVRPVKGVDVLLRSLRLLADRGSPAKLLVVGGSFYQNYRREDERLRRMAAELGLGARVQFLGEKPLPELVRYMQESAVLVLPSRAESFGQVLVEALACGTPVVATRCGGPEDIVTEEVGVLVPPEDPEALARGIEHVLNRPAGYDPGKLRDHALTHFSWEKIARDTAALYREAVRLHHLKRGGDKQPRAPVLPCRRDEDTPRAGPTEGPPGPGPGAGGPGTFPATCLEEPC